MPHHAPLAGEAGLDRVRFGRSRFLAGVGGSLFGAMATYFGKTELAWGLCGDVYPCGGFEKCCCCSGTACCQAGCHQPPSPTCGGFSPYCWNFCTTSHVRITCCDWVNGNNEYCICRENTGSC
jgi:hypothetical protein